MGGPRSGLGPCPGGGAACEGGPEAGDLQQRVPQGLCATSRNRSATLKGSPKKGIKVPGPADPRAFFDQLKPFADGKLTSLDEETDNK